MIGATNVSGGCGVIPTKKARTASGAVVLAYDSSERPAESLVADINAVQNLNGYDAPWVGGSGKNLLPYPYNGTGTTTVGGITWTINDDGTVSASGTATSVSYCWLYGSALTPIPSWAQELAGKTVTVSAGNGSFVQTGMASMQMIFYGSPALVIQERTATIPSDLSGYTGFAVVLFVQNGNTVNVTAKPQIELGSTATAYEPYSNICPISGWDAVNVWRTGKNLIDDSKKYFNGGNAVYIGAESNAYTVNLHAGTYTISVDFSGETYGMYYREANDTANRTLWYSGYGATEATFTIEESGTFRFWAYRSVNSGGVDPTKIIHVQIELGSIATAYEPYNSNTYTYTIQLGQTVYDGSLDVTTGVLTVDSAIVDLGTLTWVAQQAGHFFYTTGIASEVEKPATNNDVADIMCSTAQSVSANAVDVTSGALIGIVTNGNIRYRFDDLPSTAAAFKTAVDGHMLLYALATPQTVQLTPTEVQMLLGNNTLWADSGDIELHYWARNKEAVLRVVAPAGSTVTVSKGSVKYTDLGHENETDQSLYNYFFFINQKKFDSVNTWNVTATLGNKTESKTIIIDSPNEYDIELDYALYIVKDGVLQDIPLTTYRTSNIYTEKTGYVEFTDTTNNVVGIFSTTDKIDVTKYSTLVMVTTGSGYSWNANNNVPVICIGSSRPTTSGASADITGIIAYTKLSTSTAQTTTIDADTYTLDVSSYSGEYYVAMCLAGTSSSPYKELCNVVTWKLEQ